MFPDLTFVFGRIRESQGNGFLAGGDGKRLLPLRRTIAGDESTQAVRLHYGAGNIPATDSLRISRPAPRQRTMLMMTRTHEAFHADHVARDSLRSDAPPRNGPGGYRRFLPVRLERVILVGIPPDAPEVESGWLEPGVSAGHKMPGSVFPVSRFREKPHQELAVALMGLGCVWNSFVMAGNVGAFLNPVRRTLPCLLDAFKSIRSSLLSRSGEAEMSKLYSRISATNFFQSCSVGAAE
jgi:mannose-1-phosphate guanylyltransferase